MPDSAARTRLPPRRDAGGTRDARDYRDFRGRRWLVVVLRAAHLAGSVGTGAAMLADGIDLHPFFILLVASGLLMFGLDLWSRRGYLRTNAGLGLLSKLALFAWFCADATHRPALFWFILVFTAVVAHAPARWRHRSWRTHDRRPR